MSSPVTEGTAATFTVTLDQAAPEAMSVPVSVTESGSTLSGTAPVSVAFLQGDTSATLSVPTAGDSVVEADSAVTATVTAGTGYTLGTGSSASVTVEDDDSATFTVTMEPGAIDEGQTATLTVAISNGVTFAEDQTIALDFAGGTAAKGTDYTVSAESPHPLGGRDFGPGDGDGSGRHRPGERRDRGGRGAARGGLNRLGQPDDRGQRRGRAGDLDGGGNEPGHGRDGGGRSR